MIILTKHKNDVSIEIENDTGRNFEYENIISHSNESEVLIGCLNYNKKKGKIAWFVKQLIK